MKIIPRNGFMHVEFLGRGDRTTKSGIVTPENAPAHDDIISLQILSVDESVENEPYHPGQVVLTQKMFCRPIRPEVAGAKIISDTPAEPEPPTAMIMAKDVMAVVEDEPTSNAN